jgi:hypothetical protein
MNESFKPFQLATSSSSNRKKNEFIYTTDNTCQPTCNGEIYTIVKKIRIFLVLFQSRGADGSLLLVDIFWVTYYTFFFVVFYWLNWKFRTESPTLSPGTIIIMFDIVIVQRRGQNLGVVVVVQKIKSIQHTHRIAQDVATVRW